MLDTLVLNSDLFETEVLQSDIPVMVDFWAEWCGPCRMLSPIVEEVAEELQGKVLVAKINVDEEQELAQSYAVQTIPTLVLFKEGKEVDRLIGVHSKDDIVKFTQRES